MYTTPSSSPEETLYQPSSTPNYQSRDAQTPPQSTPAQNPTSSSTSTSQSPSTYQTPPSTPRRRRLPSAPSSLPSLRRTESTPSSTPPDPPPSQPAEPDEEELTSHSQPLPSSSMTPTHRRRILHPRRRRCALEPGVDIRQIWADELELIEFMVNARESSGSSLYPVLNEVRERHLASQGQTDGGKDEAGGSKRRRIR
ncbi:hypothetical protein TWF696_002600 [Orbilia brochopaga]|uniref:Uncharacterized protein n=1 Tax=Orbilia brochopaga TaxID=3140254 RepID=A0AAV9U4L7_9PEZI